MRDGSENAGSSFHPARPKRLPGSCDRCWERKVRCDRAEMAGRCTNCRTSEKQTNAYNSAAKDRVAEILSVSKIYVPSSDLDVAHQTLVEVAQYARNLEQMVASLQTQIARLQASSRTPNLGPQTDDSESPGTQLKLDEQPPQNTAPSDPKMQLPNSHTALLLKTAVSHVYQGKLSDLGGQWKRPEFWKPQPWEKLVQPPEPQLSFPEQDLLDALASIYFAKINPILNILHGLSFRRLLSENLHLRDPYFGAVVLAVCAMASMYSDDPRVFIDGTNEHSSGWKWFSQVRPLQTTFSPDSDRALYQLQLICLSICFISGTAMATRDETWILAGLGLRFAQAAGVHTRKGYEGMDPLTAELYRRSVWLLLVLDAIISSFMQGRQTLFQGHEWDLEPPCICDEELWGIPDAVQPSERPSPSAYFIIYQRLLAIFWRIKGAVHPESGQIDSEVVVELDSALNKWVDEIPNHLRWNPHQENPIFLDQSAALYATYYHAQILMHGAFLPAPGREPSSSTSFPSLAICANAARSCGHVLRVQTQRGRGGLLPLPSLTTVLFDSALVLLVNVWAVVGKQKVRTQEALSQATADVENCLRVLRLYERRWKMAGRRCDMISGLLLLGKVVSDLEATEAAEKPSPPGISVFNGTSPSPHAPSTESALLPDEQIQVLERSIQETEHLFSLPLHTEELGRLPIYNSFDYEFGFPNDPNFQDDGAASFMDPGTGFNDERATGLDEDLMATDAFEMFANYGWGHWSTYLARMDQS